MKRFRASILVLVIVGAVVLTAVLAHGLRVRILWGSGGFLLGLICGGILTLEPRRRRDHRHSSKAG